VSDARPHLGVHPATSTLAFPVEQMDCDERPGFEEQGRLLIALALFHVIPFVDTLERVRYAFGFTPTNLLL
jgi:hypothetical protein